MNMINKKILFYDGECGFCHKTVKLASRWIKTRDVYFSPLQSSTCAKIKSEFNDFPSNLDSIVFYDKKQLYVGADAFFQLAKEFKNPYKLFKFFNFSPNFLKKVVYNLVARNRKKLMGSAEVCDLPDHKNKEQFILD